MAISIQALAGNIAAFVRSLGSTSTPGAGEGILSTHLEDFNGKPLASLDGQGITGLQTGLPLAIKNDNNLFVLRGDKSGGIATASTQPLFAWNVDGATLNSRVFAQFATTQTQTQTVQGVTLNSGAVNTANTSFQINLQYNVPMLMKAPVLMRKRLRATQIGVANTSIDFGFSNQAVNLGQVANLNGAYWRIDASGAAPVLAINGAVVVVGTAVNVGGGSTALNTTDYFHWGILKEDDSWTFTVQNSSTGIVFYRQVLQVPSGQAKSFISSHATPYVRTFNTGVAPTAGAQAIFSEWTVGLLDTNLNLTQSQIATGLGLGSESGPTNYLTTSNLLNSGTPSVPVLSNTVPGATTLDGVLQFAAPPGGAFDYTLFGYTVPAPYRHRTKRVIVAAKNLGAPVAVTPTQIDYFLCYNAVGSTLVNNLLRKYIGTQTFAIGSVVGAAAQEGILTVDFSECDAITEPGRVVSLVARVRTGTATALQVIETNYSNLGHF